MNNLLCHPGRTFTLDELDHTEALAASYINLNPVSDPQELEFLAGLVPFHRIPTKVLLKVVRIATGFEVSDRWVAVRAIMTECIPIPVRSLSQRSGTAESGLEDSTERDVKDDAVQDAC